MYNMSNIYKKLTPQVMQALHSKPGPMPLKIMDILWPSATMRMQDSWTQFKVSFFKLLSRRR